MDQNPPCPAPSPVDTTRWVLPTLGVIAAMVVVVGLVAGPTELLPQMGNGAGSALLSVAVLTPIALLAARDRPRAGPALLASAGFVMISFVVLHLPSIGFFTGQDWNWQGKTFDLIWLTVLLVVLSRWAREDVGIRRPRPGSLGPALWVIAVVFVIQAGLVYLTVTAGVSTFEGFQSLERLSFDITHANLVEELLWRGVLLALLDRALGTPWRFFGAQVGWGLVLTTVGFGLMHGLLMTDDGLVFSPSQILITGLFALIFGWVRARTGSVWLAYIAHCAPEIAIHAGVAASTTLN